MKKWLIAIALATAAVAAGSGTAGASSIYDDVYLTVDTGDMYVERLNYYTTPDCSPVNIGLSWSQWITDETKWRPGANQVSYEAMRDSFNYTINNDGTWGVSVVGQVEGQQNGAPRYQRTIFVYWSETSNLPLEWRLNSVGTDNLTGMHWASIQTWNNSCTPYLVASSWNPGNAGLTFSNTVPISNNTGTQSWYRNYFLTNFDVNYPVDYEGELVQDEAPTPKEQLSFTPQWIRASATDWKVEIYDRNWFTFDNVRPFYCENGLSPVINYEIENNATDELITSGVYSPTVQLLYQHERLDVNTEYRITGKYDCGAESNFEFTNSSTITYVIQSTGTLEYNVMEDCFIDEFPWFNPDGCINNLQNYINLISFGSYKYDPYEVNNFEVPQDCHVISSIGPWLGLPNDSVVCPAIPENVRTVVTPFVTFAISLTALWGITRLTRENT